MKYYSGVIVAGIETLDGQEYTQEQPFIEVLEIEELQGAPARIIEAFNPNETITTIHHNLVYKEVHCNLGDDRDGSALKVWTNRAWTSEQILAQLVANTIRLEKILAKVVRKHYISKDEIPAAPTTRRVINDHISRLSKSRGF